MSMTAETESYAESLAAWRAQAEAALRAEDGWLALAGLFWLADGRNRVGSDPSGEVALPEELAPPLMCEVWLREGVVSLGAAHPELTLSGGPPAGRPLQSDDAPAPDVLALGRLSMLVIRRGARIGLRLRDRDHPARAAFPGRRWHPIRPDLRVAAVFVPHPEPKVLRINTIIGEIEERLSPGAVVFQIDGQECRLDATSTGGGGLFFNFKDATSGRGSYPPGRFLTAPAPQGGVVTLDFNRAFNPPCAFTDFATCPLPPPQNVLAVAIPAGELAPEGHRYS
ncbi:DUF1684 domain-containing protein [Oscillochloris sp. ZM17-4]|uniref:DUF1684 domain-containing protein n=1 Tax=Oscillochloris sp. ZM17-4 TaxID=2866714 RepID=UPI001C73D476|nr:DUF1684 domain-containing protein [Oscillochloris sp. ZM17-4]MBX0327575.1 DUF1684 domain-containing protein [Oscillochloris sp. ZM17-4]